MLIKVFAKVRGAVETFESRLYRIRLLVLSAAGRPGTHDRHYTYLTDEIVNSVEFYRPNVF